MNSKEVLRKAKRLREDIEYIITDLDEAIKELAPDMSVYGDKNESERTTVENIRSCYKDALEELRYYYFENIN